MFTSPTPQMDPDTNRRSLAGLSRSSADADPPTKERRQIEAQLRRLDELRLALTDRYTLLSSQDSPSSDSDTVTRPRDDEVKLRSAPLVPDEGRDRIGWLGFEHDNVTVSDPQYGFMVQPVIIPPQNPDEPLGSRWDVRVVKDWLMNGQPQSSELVLEHVPDRDTAMTRVTQLSNKIAKEGLEPAMRAAETLAEEQGHLDPDRLDGRLFVNGPPDLFMTERQVRQGLDRDELGIEEIVNPLPHLNNLELNRVLTLTIPPDVWAHAGSTKAVHTESPVDSESIKYHFGVNHGLRSHDYEPFMELVAVKRWQSAEGEDGKETRVLYELDPTSQENIRWGERMTRSLNGTLEKDLWLAMAQAEGLMIESEQKPFHSDMSEEEMSERLAEYRLFQQGPRDPFMTPVERTIKGLPALPFPGADEPSWDDIPF